MIISRAQRAETAVTQMLAATGDGSVTAVDLRKALEMSKAIASKLAAFQARAAAVLAARESHGDGGAGVLRHATGVSRCQAEGQARTVRVLDDLPAVRDALEAGKVSFTNAARLAAAAEAAGADAVQADAGLLSKAESMSDDQFAREARRWTARHQSDGGEADHARRRARRYLKVWDGDDGMTHLRGELDPVTGERIRNRLEAEARRLRRTDDRGERRIFPQAMADALDGLTSVGSGMGSGANSRGATSNGGGSGVTGSGNGRGAQGGVQGGAQGGARDPGVDSVNRGRLIADIAVVCHVDPETGELVSQLATGEPLPPSVLELLACNASITGVLYDTAGTPLWRGTTKRTATAAQLKALIARDGGCAGCGCHPALCQAHHIKPASQGGPTTISNMVLLCWNCHHKVHHNQWMVARRHGRFELLPPVRIRFGPAHAPDPPTGGAPSGGRSRVLSPSPPSVAPAEPLFTHT
jgi:5-methylcytosine-specific restriction endonuclease McrA